MLTNLWEVLLFPLFTELENCVVINWVMGFSDSGLKGYKEEISDSDLPGIQTVFSLSTILSKGLIS